MTIKEEDILSIMENLPPWEELKEMGALEEVEFYFKEKKSKPFWKAQLNFDFDGGKEDADK